MFPKVLVLMLVSVCAVPAFAQRNELGVLGGAQISFNPNSNVGTGVVVHGSYARRLAHVPTIALYAELPVTAAFKINSELPGNIAQRDYASLFIAPGIKVKFLPEGTASPFLTVGYGWARFRQEQDGTTPDIITSTNVAQFGFGTDFKIAPYLGFRTEVRDYFSGPLQFNGSFIDRQHNITAMAGLTLRW
jgi:hypothetical protein